MKLSEIGIPNLVHDQFTVTSFCGSADAGAATTPPITAAVAITPAASPLMRVLIMEPPYGAPRLCCSPVRAPTACSVESSAVLCQPPLWEAAQGVRVGGQGALTRWIPERVEERTTFKDSVELYERRGVGREFGPRDYGP